MKLRMADTGQHRLVLLPGLDGTGQLFAPFQSVLPSTFTRCEKSPAAMRWAPAANSRTGRVSFSAK